MTSFDPPTDFRLYEKWRETDEGRRWFREQMFKGHVLYRCEQCGAEVWFAKGGGLPHDLPCPWPCRWVMRRQKPPEIWEAGGDL